VQFLTDNIRLRCQDIRDKIVKLSETVPDCDVFAPPVFWGDGPQNFFQNL